LQIPTKDADYAIDRAVVRDAVDPGWQPAAGFCGNSDSIADQARPHPAMGTQHRRSHCNLGGEASLSGQARTRPRWGSPTDTCVSPIAAISNCLASPGLIPIWIRACVQTKPHCTLRPVLVAAGSRSFGIYSSALDQVRTALLDKGFAVTPVFTAPTANPTEAGH
jgi:hypothetical protein